MLFFKFLIGVPSLLITERSDADPGLIPAQEPEGAQAQHPAVAQEPHQELPPLHQHRTGAIHHRRTPSPARRI